MDAKTKANDIIEFVESYLGLQLLQYQKELLKKLENLPTNIKIVYGRRGNMYVVSDGDIPDWLPSQLVKVVPKLEEV